MSASGGSDFRFPILDLLSECDIVGADPAKTWRCLGRLSPKDHQLNSWIDPVNVTAKLPHSSKRLLESVLTLACIAHRPLLSCTGQ
jgi:hypothetical protein